MEKVKVPTTVYSEMTPNPATMKFVANRLLVNDGVQVEYTTIEEAKNSSQLATQLFNFPFIQGVFFSSNFITLTKSKSVQWEDITLQLREFITEYLSENEKAIEILPETKPQEIVDEDKIPASGSLEKPEPSEFDKAITNILDEYVKPAVENDGGAIDFHSFKNGTVTLTLRGACSGCPSSMMTLKTGVEGLLKQMIPEVKEVVAHEL